MVGFDVGGPEQLAVGRGIVVKIGEQEAFTTVARRTIYDNNGRLHGEELAECVQRENSAERMVEEYLKAYLKLI